MDEYQILVKIDMESQISQITNKTKTQNKVKQNETKEQSIKMVIYIKTVDNITNDKTTIESIKIRFFSIFFQ